MAKSRKKTTARTPAKRAGTKRVTTSKLKGRKVTAAKRGKSRSKASFAGAVHEAAELRRRLAGSNTFED